MEKFVCLLIVCLASAEASVKVARTSDDARHPASMELEVELPDSSQKVRIPLSRNEQFEDVPMTVLSNGVKRTFSSRQVHHDSHAHYSDIATKSIISVRDVNGEKQFQGHFMHEGESYLLEHNKEGHQVKRVPITPSELLEKAKEEKSAIKRAISRKRRQAPGSSTTYVIEIGLCVAYSSYAKFQSIFGESNALTELHLYYTHILTGVDIAYRNMGDPSISIKVVNLHVDATSSDFTCMPDSSVADRLSGSVILQFLQEKKAAMGSSAPDHLMSFTAEDIHGGGSYSVCGMAYVGGTCKDIGVSINEDQGLHSWGTAAHELAHNMGSPHDGSGNACDPGNQNLMSPVGGMYSLSTVANSYRFSSCSIAKIKDYIASMSAGGCLKTSMGSQVADLAGRVPEGSRLNIDQVCKTAYPNSPGKFFLTTEAQDTPAEICAKIYCATSSGGGTSSSGLRAPAGTACGDKKSCNWNGECTADDSAPSADPTCFWGDTLSNCDQWVEAVKYEQYKSYCSYVKPRCCKLIKDPAHSSSVVCD